jgi:hypothetical protein
MVIHGTASGKLNANSRTFVLFNEFLEAILLRHLYRKIADTGDHPTRLAVVRGWRDQGLPK